MIGVVYSVIDPAGKGVADYLVKELGLRELSVCAGSKMCLFGDSFILAGFSEDVIYFDFLDSKLPNNIEFYVVISRHFSEMGTKSYTVHTPGNFTDSALYGGRSRELGIAFPSVKWFLLRTLNKLALEFKKKDEYEVSYEATHHGPTNLMKPIVFIEIGSRASEWMDPINHTIVGEAVKALIRTYPFFPECTPVIGIGGGHYPRKHTELSLRESLCYGHIASKHVLEYLDIELLHAMVKRSRDSVKGIIVEKKSTKHRHRALVENFSQMTRLSLRYI